MKDRWAATKRLLLAALLPTAGVVGLAIGFSLSEPAAAAAPQVKSDDVQVISEKMMNPNTPAYGKWAKAGKSKIRG